MTIKSIDTKLSGCRIAPSPVATNGPTASSALDVSRIEHENLYAQVQKQLTLIRNLEIEIHRLQARMIAIERRLSPGRKSDG